MAPQIERYCAAGWPEMRELVRPVGRAPSGRVHEDNRQPVTATIVHSQQSRRAGHLG